jgi:pantoate--beta-alanine ligase
LSAHTIVGNTQMEIIRRRSQLISLRNSLRKRTEQIGFVPTMGALHEGHVSLIRKSLSQNDITFVSIYVNPKQFNDANDLKNYPRSLDKDIAILQALDAKNIVLFCPEKDDIYPENDGYEPISLGTLGNCLEGTMRPGHFQGVAHVVHNFFRLIEPKQSYFGQKDFQQLAVIKHLVHTLSLPVKIVACPTLRSEKGLALSSRNSLLSEDEKEQALMLYQSLQKVKSCLHLTPAEARESAVHMYANTLLQLEYLEIIDASTFEILKDRWTSEPVCCVAARCGKIRLIDNMPLFDTMFSN